MENRKYKKPPIVEAVLDIRASHPATVPGLEVIDKTRSFGTNGYPQRAEISVSGLQMGFTAGQTSLGRQFQLSGVRYIRADNMSAVDAHNEGFSYRTHQYNGWEEFLPEATRLWDIYTAAMPVSELKSVTLKYTNRFDFPISLVVSDGLFHPSVYDVVKENENKGIVAYAFHVSISQPDIDSQVTIQRGIVPSHNPEEVVSVVLDIHVFCDTIPIDNLWGQVNKMHLRGKKYFEASITDSVRDWIDQ
jgi:uncharacterized protein (TIGR04255 family)